MTAQKEHPDARRKMPPLVMIGTPREVGYIRELPGEQDRKGQLMKRKKQAMHILKYVHLRAALPLTLLMAAAVVFSACSSATAQNTGEIEGEVTTGVNRLYGQPLLEFDFMPSPFKEKFGFEMMGVYNPEGPDPLPLTALTPDDAVLASLVDGQGVGLPQAIFQGADPSLSNVPLRGIQAWVLPPNLQQRAALPGHLAGPVTGPTQAEPSGPITKGDWFKASGTLAFDCAPDGNKISIAMKALVPNRIYTVWSLWMDPSGPGSFTPLPLGGAPNSLVTDANGNATFERQLNFCPTDAARVGVDGKRLAIIDAHLHSDHTAYGAIPAPIAAGFPPGTVIQEHLSWDLGAGKRR